VAFEGKGRNNAKITDGSLRGFGKFGVKFGVDEYVYILFFWESEKTAHQNICDFEAILGDVKDFADLCSGVRRSFGRVRKSSPNPG